MGIKRIEKGMKGSNASKGKCGKLYETNVMTRLRWLGHAERRQRKV